MRGPTNTHKGQHTCTFRQHFTYSEVLSGSQAGRHIFKNSVITQASIPYVKGDLKTLGLELAKFSELSGRLEELLDVTLEVTKRTRGDYTNVYFNRRIRLAAAASGDLPAEETPF